MHTGRPAAPTRGGVESGPAARVSSSPNEAQPSPWTNPHVSGDLRQALGGLLSRAQQAGAMREDLSIDDLMSLLAGAFVTLQHAGADDSPERAARLNTVLFEGLRPRAASARGKGERP